MAQVSVPEAAPGVQPTVCPGLLIGSCLIRVLTRPRQISRENLPRREKVSARFGTFVTTFVDQGVGNDNRRARRDCPLQLDAPRFPRGLPRSHGAARRGDSHTSTAGRPFKIGESAINSNSQFVENGHEL